MKNWAIDLGTTNSAIAFADSDKAEIIKINSMNMSIPTMIITKNGELCPIFKRQQTLYDGLEENNEIFEEWKISGMVNAIKANKPLISKKGLKIEKATPINLSAKIIETLVNAAENSTGEIVENLSVSIPANFKEPARLNTLAAIKKLAQISKISN